ncbi:hypothetical protein [Flavobacterium cerinum]|uniref:Uncharacterized protein n=1 Tax=Flavobacterium cerinum TaxID=2502784 RepID=A0A3S3R0R7_9FLAO|nr:hypothetical protein [Flavobacterium cerinum]RWX00922.1 hypothetical protein EPI11_07830 [Flavobacterium cerinum]
MENFPEVWLNRVIQNLSNQNVAPWLDGIAELDTEVIEVGSGDASESNIIHIPRTNFNPEVLINNTAYPIALQGYTDDSVIVQLDKYQTKVTTLSDDQTIGASYDKIDVVTKGHTRSITTKKNQKAIHSIAPQSNTVATPVLIATGAPLAGSTVPTLVYEDLVTFKGMLDDIEGISDDERRLVLCTRHWNDLLRDRKNFGDQLVNYNTGKPAPLIAGFEIFQYGGNPLYTDAGVKKAFGATKNSTDRQASVAFWKPGIAKKTGLTKQYFAKAENDPETQTNKLNYRHYFIAVPFQNMFIGAIV